MSDVRRVRAALAAALALICAPAARAHHGRDFLLVQTADLPHAGELYLIPRQDWIASGEGTLELEPSLLWGVHDRLALELHAHVGGPGLDELEYESVAPAIQLRLTPAGARWGLALSAEYELADEEAAHEPDEPEHHAASGRLILAHAGEPHPGEGEEEPHGDRFEGRLVLSGALAGGELALDLIAEDPREAPGSVEWGWAAGYRHPVAQRSSLGLELIGSFEDDRDPEALLGAYFEPSERWQVNVGAGAGLGDDAPDWTLRTALVVRLR